ncbi:MAG: hypothetical protein L0215_26010 [Gemmataceae bacterium]|nr:hypothetical protein [Gemmataceae bacterium]
MKKSANQANWIGLIGIAALAIGMLLIATGPSSARYRGRVLSEKEMAAVFGDAPGVDPCRKISMCRLQLLEGTSECAYCDINFGHDICCNLGTGTTCDPGGGPKACDGNPFMVGTKFGSLGTCNTCDSAQFSKKGTCSLKHAIGTGGTCP